MTTWLLALVLALAQGVEGQLIDAQGQAVSGAKVGATHARRGIQRYPTTLLTDPQGKLVGLTSPEDMERRLKAMAENPISRLR